MAVLVLLSIILVRNLKVENPGKKQLVLETIITTFNNLFKGVIGEAGMKYVPYLITVILYIGMANIMGVFGFKPPTKDLNVTASLAVMSIVLVEAAGIRMITPPFSMSITSSLSLTTRQPATLPVLGVML